MWIQICCRSPSPEPIYNNEGKRLNTREYRTRKKLEDDRHTFIQRMLTINQDYKPPADYKYVVCNFCIFHWFLKEWLHSAQQRNQQKHVKLYFYG